MLHDRAIADLTAIGADFDEIVLPLSISEYRVSGGDITSVESHALAPKH